MQQSLETIIGIIEKTIIGIIEKTIIGIIVLTSLSFYQLYDLGYLNFLCTFDDELCDNVYCCETICILQAKMNSYDSDYGGNSLRINN